MSSTNATLELLTRAVDVSALRQSVYASNIANASVEGYRRLEVSFDRELERVSLQMQESTGGDAAPTLPSASIIATDMAVRLDQEMAIMAKNALRYQVLLGAFEKTMGLLRTAVREGRE